MKPPCFCGDRPDPSRCRVCWLYENSPRHRLAWDGPAGPARQAGNFVRALGAHLRAGLPLADDATVERRLEACRSCEAYSPTQDSCQICGCRVTRKARWAEQRCPANRWGGVSSTEGTSNEES